MTDSPPRRRGPDRKRRVVQLASLANLHSPVLDGTRSVVARLRLSPAAARAWERMTHEERAEVVEAGMKALRR